MECVRAWQNLLPVGLVVCLALLAPARADAEEVCFEVELRSSPLHFRTGDKADCSVMNLTDEDVDVEIEFKDKDDDAVQPSTEFGDVEEDHFVTATYMVPLPGAEIVCEVEVIVCVEDYGDLEEVIEDFFERPPASGNLRRRDFSKDTVTSELRVVEVEEED